MKGRNMQGQLVVKKRKGGRMVASKKGQQRHAQKKVKREKR
jgi:hypothetical protein